MYKKNALPKNTNIAIIIVGCVTVRKELQSESARH